MKAEELRIGNWVSSRCHKGLETQIFAIRSSEVIGLGANPLANYTLKEIKPIKITEEWLLKFGFENWGKGKQWSNQYEAYDRFVLHNDLDGTSNFEVHNVISNYSDSSFQQFIISCDEDERINWGSEIKYVHQLQNLYFALTNKELITNN